MTRGISIILLVLLPVIGFAQTATWTYTKPILKPTGRYRTIKQPFTTIYSPKMYKGWIMQQEVSCSASDTTYVYWDDIWYVRKRLIGKKKYYLWEIYRVKL